MEPLSETVQVPLNQSSAFGALLSAEVRPSVFTQTSSDFADSLTLTVTSADPNVTVVPVPEPAPALQLVAVLATLGVLRSPRSGGRRS